MRESRRNILKALMSDPKNSDRNIAKVAGVSQPTITRVRKFLVEKGIITSYEIIPNLEKLGFEIIVFTMVDVGAYGLVTSDEQVVHALEGEFVNVLADKKQGKILVMSIHVNYADYEKFLAKCRTSGYEAEPIFLATTEKESLVQPLSFKNIPF